MITQSRLRIRKVVREKPASTSRAPKGMVTLFVHEFNSELKNLITKSKMKGNFATHSLSRGGTTTLVINSRAPIAYVKGQWKSNCIFKYIIPTLGDKCVLDKKITLR